MIRLLHIGLSATGEPINGLQRAFMKKCVYKEINTATPTINEVIKDLSHSFRPELVWIQVQKRDIVSIEAVQYLRQNGAFVINWSGDKREGVPSFYTDLGPHIDLSTFSNQEDVDHCNSLGIKSDFLQIGYDPEIYSPEGEQIYTPDIVFLGNHNGKFPLSPQRYEMVNFLKNVFGSQFGFYGNGWLNANGSYMGDQVGEAKILRSAKIAINLSHFDCDRYSSDRLFRALGSGVMVLSHYYNGIEKDFQPKEHLDVWKDLIELKNKIQYYLNCPKLRQDIAMNGYNLAKEKYTFDCMIDNILKIYIKHKQ